MLARAIADDIRPDYTMDQPYFRYTGTDHAVWRQLFERQGALLQGRACQEFLAGLAGLGVAKEGIPQFDRLTSAVKQDLTAKIDHAAGDFESCRCGERFLRGSIQFRFPRRQPAQPVPLRPFPSRHSGEFVHFRPAIGT